MNQTGKKSYKNHSEKRETIRNANQNTTRRAGYKKVNDPPPPPTPHPKAFRIKGALWNAGQNKNTNNNS